MKKLILFVILILVLESCKKDDSVNPTNGTTPTTSPQKPVKIISVEKNDLSTGSILEIRGENFSTNPADNVITINGVKALDVITVNTILGSRLQATIPWQATSGSLTLTANGNKFDLGNVNIDQFIPNNEWEIAPSFPGIDSFNSVFKFQDKVFFWGDYDFDSKYQLYEFNGIKWTKKNDVPFDILSGASAFTLNGKGYLILSQTKVSGVLSRAVWEYEPTTDKWSEIANFPGSPRFSPLLFTIKNKAYFGLGSDESGMYLNDIWEFDGLTKKWTRKKDYPFFSNYFGNKGENLGYSSDNAYLFMEKVPNWIFLEYNSIQDSWAKKVGQNYRSYNEPSSYKDKMYGIANRSFGSRNFHTVESYDVNTDKFFTVKEFAGAYRFAPISFIINDRLYIGMGLKFKDLWSTKL